MAGKGDPFLLLRCGQIRIVECPVCLLAFHLLEAPAGPEHLAGLGV